MNESDPQYVHDATWPMPSDASISTIDAAHLTNRSDLLDVLGLVLHFPDYYGRNWDAFEECLGDLPEFENWRSLVLVVVHSSDAPQGLQPEFTTLKRIWSTVAPRLEERDVDAHLVLA
jgi:RNAse (barnase) inhibitor barstar